MNFIDLFKSDLTVIEHIQLDTKKYLRDIFTKQLWKSYITSEQIKEKLDKIFDYKFID